MSKPLLENPMNQNRSNKIIFRVLLIILDKIREGLDEGEQVIITIESKRPHNILKGAKSVVYLPSKSFKRELKVSKWATLENPRLMKLKQLQRLLGQQLPEIECKVIKYDNVKVLRLLWPENLEIKVIEDFKFMNSKQGIASTYSILSLLELKPDWIGESNRKGGLKNKLPIGFEKQCKIVFEGIETTWIFNEHGLRWRKEKNLEEIKTKSANDLLQIIYHTEGYDVWKNKIMKQLS